MPKAHNRISPKVQKESSFPSDIGVLIKRNAIIIWSHPFQVFEHLHSATLSLSLSLSAIKDSPEGSRFESREDWYGRREKIQNYVLCIGIGEARQDISVCHLIDCDSNASFNATHHRIGTWAQSLPQTVLSWYHPHLPHNPNAQEQRV
jgi:hypothetical protein